MASSWPTTCAEHQARFGKQDDGSDYVLSVPGNNDIKYVATCFAMSSDAPRTYLNVDATGVNTQNSFAPVSFQTARLYTQPYLALDLCDASPADAAVQAANVHPGSIFTERVDASYTAKVSLVGTSFRMRAPDNATITAEGSNPDSPWYVGTVSALKGGSSTARLGLLSADNKTVTAQWSVSGQSKDSEAMVWQRIGVFHIPKFVNDDDRYQHWATHVDTQYDEAFRGWPGAECPPYGASRPLFSDAKAYSGMFLEWDGAPSTVVADASTGRVKVSHTAAIAGGVTGGVVALLAIVAGVIYVRRRRQAIPHSVKPTFVSMSKNGLVSVIPQQQQPVFEQLAIEQLAIEQPVIEQLPPQRAEAPATLILDDARFHAEPPMEHPPPDLEQHDNNNNNNDTSDTSDAGHPQVYDYSVTLRAALSADDSDESTMMFHPSHERPVSVVVAQVKTPSVEAMVDTVTPTNSPHIATDAGLVEQAVVVSTTAVEAAQLQDHFQPTDYAAAASADYSPAHDVIVLPSYE
ncbi:hypothetical protein RI367_004918 [Sorochytrium milnesiophthora]